MEGKILGAEERSVKLEYELFLRVREEVIAHLTEIQQTARALAQLDVLAGFAETARLYNYCRPEIGDRRQSCIFARGAIRCWIRASTKNGLFPTTRSWICATSKSL